MDVVGYALAIQSEQSATLNGSWSAIASNPHGSGGRLYGGNSFCNGLWYLSGAGQNGTASNSTLFSAYDPTSNTWTSKSSPGVNFQEGAIAAVPTVNKIIAVTGTTAAYRYNILDNTWTNLGLSIQARGQFPFAGVNNGFFHLAGGYNTGSQTNLHQALDVAANTWTTKATMPSSGHGLTSGSGDGFFYTLPQVNFLGSAVTLQLHKYSFAANTWTYKASCPVQPGAGIGVYCRGKLYLLGANAGVYTGTTAVYSYNVETDTWAIETAMATQRAMASAGASDTEVFITNGYTTGSSVVTALAEKMITPVTFAEVFATLKAYLASK